MYVIHEMFNYLKFAIRTRGIGFLFWEKGQYKYVLCRSTTFMSER